MTDPLWLVTQFCGAHPLALHGGMLLGLAVAGAAGSAVHCAPMCGPFVLGQVADRMARLPAARLHENCRVTQGLLLPYHMGRLTSYAALGAVAAAFGTVLAAVPWFGAVRVVLLLVAAALFLAHALGRLAPVPGGAAPFGRALRRVTRRIDRSSALGTYGLGLVLGFLPCGFLYAALMAAAASPGPATGALAMLAFGLGTTPVLAALGVAGRVAGRSVPVRFAPALLAFNAGMIVLIAIAS